MEAKSIDEGRFIPVNGIQQWIAVRGQDVVNPVMLIISGPGMALSSIAPYFADWEKYFTLVYWDQPGAGATHSVSPRARDDLSMEMLVMDGIGVVEQVRRQLNVEKITVLGISAGSIIGLHMMHKRPQYFAAYVGTGQFVNWAQQDALSYKQLLADAKAEGNAEAIEELTTIGSPPYADSAVDVIKSKYHSAPTAAEMAAFPTVSGLMVAALSNPPVMANYLAKGVTLENPRALATKAYELLRPELLVFDAWSLPREYSMPLLFVQGALDVYSVTSVVQQYEDHIMAPSKKTILIEEGGHGVIWLQSQFLQILNRELRPLLGC